MQSLTVVVALCTVGLISAQLDFGSRDNEYRGNEQYLPPSPARSQLVDKFSPSQNTIQTSSEKKPTQIFFEDLHYKNKATEDGFCNDYCGSVRSEIQTKPGKCPPIVPGSYRGNCQDECKYDSECPKQQRCCNNGCANVCLQPIFRTTCSDLNCAADETCIDDGVTDARCVSTVERTGRCPAFQPGAPLVCVNECQYDAECGGNQKCCYNGCAMRCVGPDLRKRCSDLRCAGSEVCVDNGRVDAKCVTTVPNAGRCPAFDPRAPRTCTDECQFDAECGAGRKCCNNGCANVCVGADLRKRCEDVEAQCGPDQKCVDDGLRDARCVSTTPKIGRCPAFKLGQYKTCKDECTYDAECSGNQKCCHNGCAFVCVGPVLRKTCSDIPPCAQGEECVDDGVSDAKCWSTEPKEGFCPKSMNNSRPTGSCKDTCLYDSQCDGANKCCWNGCANVCLKPRKPDCDTIKCKVGYKCIGDRFGNPKCAPIPCKQDGEIIDIECNSCTCIQGFLLCSQEECPPVKPGFCPKVTKGYRGKCAEDCNWDDNCEGDQKCCWTGCGHTCKAPIPEIVHPCKTVRFRCGDQTRCAATRGLCVPGKTCPLSPLCVSNKAPYCGKCPEGKVCVLQKQRCPTGRCQRQPICIQLYSDDTIFEEDEELESQVVARQQGQNQFT